MSTLDDFSDGPPPLSPPRFSLRTLLLLMALAGVLLAAIKIVGGLFASVLLLFALAVVAHVAGNAIGTRLRDHRQAARGPRPAAERPAVLSQEDFAPTTNLSHRQSLGWPLWAAVGLGAAAGAAWGTWFFLSTDAAKATWQDTSLGALAMALLGAMAGFVMGGFAQVLVRAWRQASDE